MKRSVVPSLFATTFSFVTCGLLLGCSPETTDSSAEPSAVKGGDPAQGPGQESTNGDGAPSAAEIDAGCMKYFNALVARRKRCGLGRTLLRLDASEGARDSFLAVCRQRSARDGTGYTPQFHETCAIAFEDSACDDYDTIVASCWEPRGTLAAGAGCSTDDQCADGYCKLPSDAKPGSTCGTCAAPIWAREGVACYGKRDVKCLPGLACEDNAYLGHSGACQLPDRLDAKEGEDCKGVDGTGSEFDKFCGAGLYCKGGTCVPQTIVSIGETCEGDERDCEDGSDCVPITPYPSPTYACVRSVGIGEACRVDHGGYCNGWVVCGATGKCELKQPDLQCSSAPAAPASDEPMKCVGTASSCSGRAAGTCASQDGCSFVQHYHYSPSGGYLESECEGTPMACSSIETKSRCLDQAGCRWE